MHLLVTIYNYTKDARTHERQIYLFIYNVIKMQENRVQNFYTVRSYSTVLVLLDTDLIPDSALSVILSPLSRTVRMLQ